MLNTETEKFNLRVGMKIIRTAAELRDTWINFPQTKERKPNEKDLKHQIYIICGIPIDMYIVFVFFRCTRGA